MTRRASTFSNAFALVSSSSQVLPGNLALNASIIAYMISSAYVFDSPGNARCTNGRPMRNPNESSEASRQISERGFFESRGTPSRKLVRRETCFAMGCLAPRSSPYCGGALSQYGYEEEEEGKRSNRESSLQNEISLERRRSGVLDDLRKVREISRIGDDDGVGVARTRSERGKVVGEGNRGEEVLESRGVLRVVCRDREVEVGAVERRSVISMRGKEEREKEGETNASRETAAICFSSLSTAAAKSSASTDSPRALYVSLMISAATSPYTPAADLSP